MDNNIYKEMSKHWITYAHGIVKEKNVADANWIISVDRHLFLGHFAMTQMYLDNKKIDHYSKWFITLDRAINWWAQIVKPLHLTVEKGMEYIK